MSREPNEIWKTDVELPRSLPWRAQMANYIAQFATEEQAQRYVTSMKKIEGRASTEVKS